MIQFVIINILYTAKWFSPVKGFFKVFENVENVYFTFTNFTFSKWNGKFSSKINRSVKHIEEERMNRVWMAEQLFNINSIWREIIEKLLHLSSLRCSEIVRGRRKSRNVLAAVYISIRKFSNIKLICEADVVGSKDFNKFKIVWHKVSYECERKR